MVYIYMIINLQPMFLFVKKIPIEINSLDSSCQSRRMLTRQCTSNCMFIYRSIDVKSIFKYLGSKLNVCVTKTFHKAELPHFIKLATD